ncbi:hypothetical protein GYMLUDRAFT_704455 [Collybiopsis luxurians FD-317 M1]|uniref:NB-ARC domain-containing protein n=1 Tax=Collybiopsis luxurians FD-317 M1 TaxID=944289 RepID=A0A0D0B463_9AGAR|nr:hypothetical protein GYMLUDRAFT_704455 [Collybiopsis luxurians FD-317 M1]
MPFIVLNTNRHHPPMQRYKRSLSWSSQDYIPTAKRHQLQNDSASGSVSILSGASSVRIDGSPTFNAAGRDVIVNHYHAKQIESGKPDLFMSPSQVLICPSPTQYFVGRQDILDKLVRIFSTPALQQKVVPLVASGGTGKTQVVLQFVAQNHSKFSNIWFFNATSKTALLANFNELGKALGVGEKVEDVKKYLARNQDNWLCIFDNADNDQLYLKEYIASCDHGNIIITSRLGDTIQMAFPGPHIDFGDLSKEDAVTLLLKHAHKEHFEENKDFAMEIVHALGYHALAVATAGAYIHKAPTCTLGNYLAYFKTQQKKILNYRLKTVDNYQETVYSTFKLSFDQLSYSTQCFSQICAYLHPLSIPIAMFTQAAAFTGEDIEPGNSNPPTSAIQYMRKFLTLFQEEGRFETSIEELHQLCLVSYNESEGSITFHPVIHACIRETSEYQPDVKQAAMLILAQATPYGQTDKELQMLRQLLVHASQFEDLLEVLPALKVQDSFAKIFTHSGFWKQAERINKAKLQWRKKNMGITTLIH